MLRDDDIQDKSIKENEREEVTGQFISNREENTAMPSPTISYTQPKPPKTKSITSNSNLKEMDEVISLEHLKKLVPAEMIEVPESLSHSPMQSEPSGRSLEPRIINSPRLDGSSSVTFPGRHTKRQYAIGRPIDVYVQESVRMGIQRPIFSVPLQTNVHHYIPFMPPFPSYYSDSPGAHTAPVFSQRIPSIQPPTIALSSPSTPPPAIILPSQSSESEHIKFSNSAGTLNAYANLLQEAAVLSSRPASQAEDSQKGDDIIQPRFNSTFDVDISPSTKHEKQSTRTTAGRNHPNKSRHPSTNFQGKLYNNFTRVGSNYSGERWPYNKNRSEFKNPSPHKRHPSLPRDSGVTQSENSHNQSLQILSINHGLAHPYPRRQDPVKYIEQLTVAHYHNTGSIPISPPSVQNERLKELARQLNRHNEDVSGRVIQSPTIRKKRELTYNTEKYPFYSPSIVDNKHSAFRYASNPRLVPKKSPGGMEFYESRDRLIRCEEPEPPEDIIPQQEQGGEWNKKPIPKDLPRIKGIGNLIICHKIKYWGWEPLDNPFFSENTPGKPWVTDIEQTVRTDMARHLRRIRSTQVKNKRLMIVPPSNDNSSNNGQKHHNYTDSEMIRGSSNHETFPYKNHKPADAVVSLSVHQVRANSPYRYYSQLDESYFPVGESEDSGQDNEGYDTKIHKYYLHKSKHKLVYKRKRVRPPYNHRHQGIRRPFPVSIYSIIGASNQHPVYIKPVTYASSKPVYLSGVTPGYHLAPPKTSDNVGKDSSNVPNTVTDNQPVAPTRWYIVRPGEYTENKDIASEIKPSASSSFWAYMNPLRWWFPGYFDHRRNEPRYRRRRSSDHELFNRILAKTNLSAVEPRVFESYRTGAPGFSRLTKAETTTSSPISIQEFKSRLNSSADQHQKPAPSKLSRLTGFISKHNVNGTTPSYTYSLNAPIYGADKKFAFELRSNTPMFALPVTSDYKSTTAKPKVSFPRTKNPSKRRPMPTKKAPISGIRSDLTSTTTTTTTPPSTTTRMYKPKRIISMKKFDRRLPVDAFSVLKRAKQPLTSGSQFDSFESEKGSESREGEEPKRLQRVEHRRVTKEEVYKTSYMPEESLDTHRNVEESMERYSRSSSENSPPLHGSQTTTMSFASQERARGDGDHTLTYMVNPVTGVGSWGEQPSRTAWKPKLRYPKHHLADSSSSTGYHQPALYSYPALGPADIEQKVTTSMAMNKKLHSEEEYLNNGDYVARLVPQVSTGGSNDPDLKSHESAEKEIPVTSRDKSQLFDGRNRSVEDRNRSEDSTSPLIKSSPKFVMDPGKRKYFYVKTW